MSRYKDDIITVTVVVLFVILFLWVLIALLTTGHWCGPPEQHRKRLNIKHTINNLESILRHYKNKKGEYPPQNDEYNSKPLVEYLYEMPKKNGDTPYIDLKEENIILKNGRMYSPFAESSNPKERYEIHYRKPIKTVEEATMNMNKPNIWTADDEGNDRGLNNWDEE